METKMQEDSEKNPKPQAEESTKEKTNKGEKLNLYDNFLSIHFDFKNKSLNENEIRKTLENEYNKDAREATKIEFWFRLFYNLQTFEFTESGFTLKQERAQEIIEFIKLNIDNFAISRIENSFSNNEPV